MEQLPSNSRPRGGFAFDLCSRDQQIGTSIAGAGGRLPQAMKTGTTIVGVIYKDGVVLGADTRATGGTEVRMWMGWSGVSITGEYSGVEAIGRQHLHRGSESAWRECQDVPDRPGHGCSPALL